MKLGTAKNCFENFKTSFPESVIS